MILEVYKNVRYGVCADAVKVFDDWNTEGAQRYFERLLNEGQIKPVPGDYTLLCYHNSEGKPWAVIPMKVEVDNNPKIRVVKAL